MSLNLQDKVILITGSSKGIGRATALRLSQAGACLVINYLSDRAAAESLINELQGGADRALAVQADASKTEDINRLVDAAVARFGRIDVVIPNAGIMMMRDLQATTEDDFDRSFGLNVKGAYFLAKVSSLPQCTCVYTLCLQYVN
jgi:3-oxoacyl-[acyl-carrier protein] reductase